MLRSSPALSCVFLFLYMLLAVLVQDLGSMIPIIYILLFEMLYLTKLLS